MADNSQKTTLGKGLSQGYRAKSLKGDETIGNQLPASIMEVSGHGIFGHKFEMGGTQTMPSVSVAVAGSEYYRFPFRVGMDGKMGTPGVFSGGGADLGHVNGQGPSTAPTGYERPGNNQSSLIFAPIGNKNWEAVDPDTTVLYGPDKVGDGSKPGTKANGMLLMDTVPSKATVKITLTATGVTIDLGMQKLTVKNGDVHFTGNLVVDGDVTATSNKIQLGEHLHSQVLTGSDDTGPPVPDT